MEKTIYKYPLQTTNVQILELPKGAEVLTVQTQNDTPQLWAVVDPENELEKRIIEIIGTGHPVRSSTVWRANISRKYISTYQLFAGKGVFHVFERLQ